MTFWPKFKDFFITNEDNTFFFFKVIFTDMLNCKCIAKHSRVLIIFLHMHTMKFLGFLDLLISQGIHKRKVFYHHFYSKPFSFIDRAMSCPIVHSSFPILSFRPMTPRPDDLRAPGVEHPMGLLARVSQGHWARQVNFFLLLLFFLSQMGAQVFFVNRPPFLNVHK